MLNHTRITLCTLALCLPATFALAADPPAPKAAAVHAGEDVFNSNCTACHSIKPDEVRFGPSLYGELKQPHPKKTDEEVREILKEGKNGKMPSFDGKLKPEDIDNLLAYLHTL